MQVYGTDVDLHGLSLHGCYRLVLQLLLPNHKRQQHDRRGHAEPIRWRHRRARGQMLPNKGPGTAAAAGLEGLEAQRAARTAAVYGAEAWLALLAVRQWYWT